MAWSIIRNHEMLNRVHDNGGKFSVALNLFQGLMNTDRFVFDDGLWYDFLWLTNLTSIDINIYYTDSPDKTEPSVRRGRRPGF